MYNDYTLVSVWELTYQIPPSLATWLRPCSPVCWSGYGGFRPGSGPAPSPCRSSWTSTTGFGHGLFRVPPSLMELLLTLAPHPERWMSECSRLTTKQLVEHSGRWRVLLFDCVPRQLLWGVLWLPRSLRAGSMDRIADINLAVCDNTTGADPGLLKRGRGPILFLGLQA